MHGTDEKAIGLIDSGPSPRHSRRQQLHRSPRHPATKAEIQLTIDAIENPTIAHAPVETSAAMRQSIAMME